MNAQLFAKIMANQKRMERIRAIGAKMLEIANGMILEDATNGLDDFQLLEATLAYLKEEHADQEQSTSTNSSSDGR